MENKEIIEVKENKILERVGVFLGILLGYLFVPQVIGYYIFKSFHVDSIVAGLIGTAFFALIILIVFYSMFKEKIKDYFSNFLKYFKTSLKYWALGLVVMIISNLLLSFIFTGIAANEELNRNFVLGNPLFGFFSIVLIAPFVEEMIFRFGLRKLTGKSKYFPLISAIAFGVPHILAGINSPLGIDDLLQFLYVIPYGALGYAFGYIYNKTDNIFTSMTAHAIHNFMCFVVIVTLV